MRALLIAILALAAAFILWWGVARDAPTSPSKALPAAEVGSTTPASSSPQGRRPRSASTTSAGGATTTTAGESSRALSPKTFADTRLPLKKRREMLAALGRRGDDASIRLLMSVGNGRAYLRWAAVAALAEVSDPSQRAAVARYLRGKLTDADSRTAEAAARAYGRLQGDTGIKALADALRQVKGRSDGLGKLVARAIVETLGRIGTKAAADVLASELAGVVGVENWDHEYGSEVVKALTFIGGVSVRDALLRYATALEGQLPTDAMARTYVQSKIAEARAAAAK